MIISLRADRRKNIHRHATNETLTFPKEKKSLPSGIYMVFFPTSTYLFQPNLNTWRVSACLNHNWQKNPPYRMHHDSLVVKFEYEFPRHWTLVRLPFFEGRPMTWRPRSQVRNGTDWRNNIIEIRLINIAKRDLWRPWCQATDLILAPMNRSPFYLFFTLHYKCTSGQITKPAARPRRPHRRGSPSC